MLVRTQFTLMLNLAKFIGKQLIEFIIHRSVHIEKVLYSNSALPRQNIFLVTDCNKWDNHSEWIDIAID